MRNNLLKGVFLAALIIMTTGFTQEVSQPPTVPVIVESQPIPYLDIIAAEQAAAVIPVVPPRPANSSEIQCLARNVYFEARGEGRSGMTAVAHVTMNRVRDGRFRSTVCGVVYQPSQFSWVGNGATPRGPLWNLAQDVATAVYTREHANDPTNGAQYFHNRSVRPSWANRFRRTASMGGHVFYRQG